MNYLTDPEGSNHKVDTDTHVFFYEQDFYVLSNFSSFEVFWPYVRDDDYITMWHKTSEHLYHFLKFWFHMSTKQQKEVALKIYHARSAHDAFNIAQTYKGLRRPDWDSVKFVNMKQILIEKVKCHEYVRRKLLQTGDRILVEDSWRDDVWGWGPNKDGQNMLGKLWMEVREEIRQQESQNGQPKV